MRTTTAPPTATEPPATADLTALLADVAGTDLGAPAWEVLARRARAVTVALAERGLVPPHLVVAPNDPPVAAARLLSAAWRHTTTAANHSRSTARAACA